MAAPVIGWCRFTPYESPLRVTRAPRTQRKLTDEEVERIAERVAEKVSERR